MSDRLFLATVLALSCGTQACSSWQTDVPLDPASGPGPGRVYDPTQAYSSLGLLAAGGPVPFAARLGFLAGAQPDSTTALLGLSLASSALTFRRISSAFEARYRVEVRFVRDGNVLVDVSAYETVRVATFPETRRQDESIVFQRFFNLSPGIAAVRLVVTDLNGSDSSSARLQSVVPDYGMGSAQLALVPVYEGKVRSSRVASPELVMNPRAFAVYGTDSLNFYLEGYGPPDLQFARVTASTASGVPLWRDTVELVPVDSNLAAGFVHMPADGLLVGTVHVAAEQLGRPISARVSALVGVSSDWPVTDFEEILSLLRYFGNSRSHQRLREAPAAELSHQWREFWHDTDPDPTTAENEALSGYLEDLEAASARFSEPGRPGWLTERGEVFLTLGKPDVIRDVQGGTVPGGNSLIRWDYEAHELVLYFVSEGGDGTFRLTPTSRVEYSDAVKRRKGTDGG